MGSVMAAIGAMKTWGQVPQPHIKSHFDCECSNDSPNSSSSSEGTVNDQKSTMWLQRHRPFPEKEITSKGKDHKSHHGK
jgi:hypothetical protein